MDTAAAGGPDAAAPAEQLEVVPIRHPGRWVAAAIVLLVLAMFAHWLVATKGLGWDVVRQSLFNSTIEAAARRTVLLTVLAMLIGISLGITLAVMRLSPNPIVSGAAWVYIWFFRGTPVLVQVLFWYNLPAIMTSFSLGVPFGPSWFHTDPKSIITQLGAALLGLGLNEAAYMAEIARAGLLSVDEGQTEAAQALGMTRGQTLRRIVLPQAMRVIVPPTGNETISMLKTTSIVFSIGYLELTTTAQIIGARTFNIIPLYVTISVWYLAMTSVLYVGQYYLERRFARGSSRDLPPTPIQKLRRLVFTLRSSPEQELTSPEQEPGTPEQEPGSAEQQP
jgi:polar amino acid transport system permease protein